MTKQKLTLYLTYEFGMQFGLKSLKRIIQHKEAKIWIDEETGYPSFSYGGYHGRRTEDSQLLRIGCDEIHIRIEKSLVEKLALAQAHSDMQMLDAEVIKDELIYSVYRQISMQIDSVYQSFSTPMVEMMIKEKSNEVNDAQALINKLNKGEVKHVAH